LFIKQRWSLLQQGWTLLGHNDHKGDRNLINPWTRLKNIDMNFGHNLDG
jgi:hypothetical protein